MMAATKKTSDNMSIYEGHRQPPKEALKPIQAGRLKGFSDINPMWRLKALTEEFGPCGIGWYYTVDKQWIEVCGNETLAFVNISLYVKVDGEWSKPIFGNGGSKLVSQERSGAFVSDEAFKMSVTDAIGVAAKQLGIAADVYFANDRTKYTPIEDNSSSNQNTTKQKSTTNSSAKPSQENTHQSETPQAKEQTAEELAATPSEEVDKRLLRTNDNKMSKEQYEYLMSEIERTGSMADVVAYAKTEDLTTLSSGKCVALLTGLLKRPTKKS